MVNTPTLAKVSQALADACSLAHATDSRGEFALNLRKAEWLFAAILFTN
jgi:hypothetical protein